MAFRLENFAYVRLAYRKADEGQESAASIEAHYTELKSERIAFKKSQESCEKILNNINKCKKELFDINGKKLPELQKFLRYEMHDLDLQEHPDVIKAKIFAAASKCENAYKDKQKLAVECEDTELKLNQARADLQKFLNAIDSARSEMDEALSKSRKISDEIINFRARTAEAVLAEERIKLKAGDPCPLCGSLEHPAARHLKTSSDKAAELFKTTEMLEKNFKQAQRKYEEAKNKFDALDNKYNNAVSSERALSGPTENLSGGEKFIVSLVLALGLSQISGSKTRVDSLFLDEGFGSLDEEALNTALEALGEVRREGRMIGIISHIQALKERIT